MVSEPDPMEQHFQTAQTFQLANDLPHAANEYRTSISIGLQHLGNLRNSEHKYPEAVELLATAVQIDPANTDANIDLAVVHFYLAEWDQARGIVELLLRTDPTNYRALNLLGKIEFMQGNFQAAADRLQAALAIKPDFDIVYSLALADLQLKKLPEAVALFDEMKASTKSSPDLLMLIGRAYRVSGIPEQAAIEFQRAIARDPALPHAHSLLGLTYLMEGEQKYQQAQQQFEAELAVDPKDSLTRYYLGVVKLQLNDIPGAQSNLERVLQERPETPGAYLYLGQVYLKEGRFEQASVSLRTAIVQFTKAQAQDSTLAQAHSLLSDALRRQGKNTEASAESAVAEKLSANKVEVPGDAATPLTEVRPQDAKVELSQMMQQGARNTKEKPAETLYVNSVSKLLAEAYHNLAVIDAREARYSVATEEFSKAARWNPGITMLDRNWGIAAFRAGEYERAIGPLDRHLHRSPDDVSVRQMLGVSYFMVDNFDKSIETFRPILGELPDNPGLLYAAGISLVRSGDSAGAKSLFQRMLEHGENIPEVHLVLGEAYSHQSQYAQALQEFERAAAMNSKLPDLHFFTGMVKFKEGKLDVAAKEFEAELSLNPQSIPAMYQLAYVHLQQRQPEQAIPLLTKVLETKPAYADAHYQLGKAFLEINDVDGAIQHLETATKLQPSESYGFYQLSLAYRRAGRLAEADQALRTYQELKDKNPHRPSS